MEQNIITLSPGKGNATPMVVEALSRMDPEKENLLRFEKGTYEFFREGTLCREYDISNNCGGEKKMVFPILEQKHLTIDGEGATFLFHGRIFPFLLDKSEDITLKNFIVDFDVARHAQGELVAQTKEYYDLKFDRTMNPFTVENGNITFRIGEEEERSSRDSLSLLHEFDMDAHQWDVSVLGSVYLQVGETTADLRNLATGLWKTHATQLSEDTVRFTFDSPRDTLPFHQVGHFVTMNIENRDNAIFFLNQSKDVTLQNCEIVRGAGMGVIAQLSENITADGLSIHVKEGRKDVVSITADAFHCVNCSGKVTVKNSFFADTMDDACNIHGIYTRIQKVEGNRVTASLSHQDQAGFLPYFPGDQVEIIDGESLCIKGRVTVLDSQLAEGDKMTLCLTIGAPEGFHICPGDLIESPDRMPEVLYENNVLRNCPRILLSSCKKMVVRGNDIYNKVHGVKITDCPDYWYESGRVKDVLIEDNIFRNCGYCWECGVIVINQQPGRSIVHENIRILRNRFEDTVSNFFDVSYVNGLTVEDNLFEIRPDWEKTAPQIPYKISHCTNVEIKNNVMKFL